MTQKQDEWPQTLEEKWRVMIEIIPSLKEMLQSQKEMLQTMEEKLQRLEGKPQNLEENPPTVEEMIKNLLRPTSLEENLQYFEEECGKSDLLQRQDRELYCRISQIMCTICVDLKGKLHEIDDSCKKLNENIQNLELRINLNKNPESLEEKPQSFEEKPKNVEEWLENLEERFQFLETKFRNQKD